MVSQGFRITIIFPRVLGRGSGPVADPAGMRCKKHMGFQGFPNVPMKILRIPVESFLRPAADAYTAEAGNVDFPNDFQGF